MLHAKEKRPTMERYDPFSMCTSSSSYQNVVHLSTPTTKSSPATRQKLPRVASSFDGGLPCIVRVLWPCLIIMSLCIVVSNGAEIDNRTIPDEYSYHEEHHETFVTREYLMHEVNPRIRLICPKNYFISKVRLALHFSPDFIRDNNPQPILKEPFTHYLILSAEDESQSGAFQGNNGSPVTTNEEQLVSTEGNGDEKHDEEASENMFEYEIIPKDDDQRRTSLCPSLDRCLGYVGCLFTFGNEFCLGDPLPGNRKVYNVNVTCHNGEEMTAITRDQMASEMKQETGGVATTALTETEIKRRTAQVINLQYRSQVESAVPDYTSTNITGFESSVEDVLHVSCVRDDYRGECDVGGGGEEEGGEGGEANDVQTAERRARDVSPERVGDDLWHVLARSRCPVCRDELLQVYCSFRFNSLGRCLPPFAVEPGQSASISNASDLRFSHQLFPTLYQSKFARWGQREANVASIEDVLRPVRLAYLILVHTDPEAVLHQLSLLYHSAHKYLYHVDQRQPDVRKELLDGIARAYPRALNIRVLDASESFVPSWGSYSIVRAELQGFRTLLEYPDWEYVIKLSGSDLPIRSFEDVAFTLAAYRGRSLIPSMGLRNENAEKNEGLLQDVWHGCGGFVYNVTRGGGQPPFEDLPVYTGSQWSVPHRSFVEFILSEDRTRALKRHSYHLATSIIPDESFTATHLFNSPHRDTFLNTGLHWMKTFKGQNALHLCRHMEDTDFCGQGPNTIEVPDFRWVAESSHREFFARKFDTYDPNVQIRRMVSHHLDKGYYEGIDRYMSDDVIRHLVEISLWEMKLKTDSARLGNEQQEQQKPQQQQQWVLDNLEHWDGSFKYKYRVIPRLHDDNPCCQLPVKYKYKIVHSFAIVIDWEMEIGEQAVTHRSRLLPRTQFSCYCDGHLRVLRHTTWTADTTHQHIKTQERNQLSVNLPFPNAFAPVSLLFVEIWMHAGEESIEGDCQKQQPLPNTPFFFPNLNVSDVTADTVTVEAGVEDSGGVLRCYIKHQMAWNKDTVREDGNKDRVEMPGMFTLPCVKPLETGTYKIVLQQMDIENARIYELPLTVLPKPATVRYNGRTDNVNKEPIRVVNQGGWQPSEYSDPSDTEEGARDSEGSPTSGKKGYMRTTSCVNCGEIGSFSNSEDNDEDILEELWTVEAVAVLNIQKKKDSKVNMSWSERLARWVDDL